MGSIIVLRSRSQEIASSTYSFLVVSLYFAQDCRIIFENPASQAAFLEMGGGRMLGRYP